MIQMFYQIVSLQLIFPLRQIPFFKFYFLKVLCLYGCDFFDNQKDTELFVYFTKKA